MSFEVEASCRLKPLVKASALNWLHFCTLFCCCCKKHLSFPNVGLKRRVRVTHTGCEDTHRSHGKIFRDRVKGLWSLRKLIFSCLCKKGGGKDWFSSSHHHQTGGSGMKTQKTKESQWPDVWMTQVDAFTVGRKTRNSLFFFLSLEKYTRKGQQVRGSGRGWRVNDTGPPHARSIQFRGFLESGPLCTF